MASGKTADLTKIQMLVMDVDGVLTDGTVMIHPDGTESKRFNLLDGHGIKLWHRAGFLTAFISGRESEATNVRARQLGVKNVIQGCKKKLPAYEELLKQTGLEADQTAYIGDDLLDIPLAVRAGFSAAVSNAVDELKEKTDYITKASGGSGAVREVIEYILKKTGRWEELMQRYLI